MNRFPDAGVQPIGETLAAARERAGLDIRAMEERTKIRARYLAALEAEDWRTLPNHAYAKGFLRTYAGELGLDAEAVVDQFRREVESQLPDTERPYPLGDQVLEHRRRHGAPARRRWIPLAAVVLLAGGAGGAYLALEGSEESDGDRPRAERAAKGKQGADKRGKKREREPRGAASGRPVTLTLVAKDDVDVCLVPGEGAPLIDGQLVRAGTTEGPYTAKGFRLDIVTGGALVAKIGDREERLASKEPARFEISSRGARPVSYSGGGKCP